MKGVRFLLVENYLKQRERDLICVRAIGNMKLARRCLIFPQLSNWNSAAKQIRSRGWTSMWICHTGGVLWVSYKNISKCSPHSLSIQNKSNGFHLWNWITNYQLDLISSNNDLKFICTRIKSCFWLANSGSMQWQCNAMTDLMLVCNKVCISV